MPTPTQRRCETCRFWSAADVDWHGAKPHHGPCRRYAPRPREREYGTHRKRTNWFEWPEVMTWNCCGEWTDAEQH